MIDDTLSHRRPRTTPTASRPLTGIPHQAGTDQGITDTVKMRREYFIDEGFFGFAFDMDQQPSHGQ